MKSCCNSSSNASVCLFASIDKKTSTYGHFHQTGDMTDIAWAAAQELVINQHLYELPLDSSSITNLMLKGQIFRLRIPDFLVALLQRSQIWVSIWGS